MMKRWSAHTWLLTALAAIILVMGGAVLRRYLESVQPARAVFIPDTYQPTFEVGDTAPDFSFPDRAGATRRLSTLVRGETVLWFTCGCARCRDLQSFMARLESRLAGKAPRVVSVTSAPPEAEAAYRRDTRLDQVILYAPPDSTAWQRYRGHPCPRAFRLAPGRRVAWIGPSPDSLSPEEHAIALARALGIDPASATREYRAIAAPRS